MFQIFRYEWKASIKTLLIWSLAVGGMGLICIILYQELQDSMGDLADSFASMGAFSDAFGMSTLSIATLKGYFATEIGTIHGLGGGMFAAALATIILSKEEDQHTTDFTFVLPLSRSKIIIMKFLAVIANIVLFTVICGIMYQIGFFVLEEQLGTEFFTYMLLQLLMNVEIAAICFLVSGFCRKNKLGIGISIVMFMYIFDLMARVIPSLEKMIFLSPYSYANATSIFSGSEWSTQGLVVGVLVIIVSLALVFQYYTKRDLMS